MGSETLRGCVMCLLARPSQRISRPARCARSPRVMHAGQKAVLGGRSVKKNREKPYTPYYLAIMIAGFVIYKIWQFANRPDALECS
jgi:hypothetical protein